MTVQHLQIIKVLVAMTLSSAIAVVFTPFLSHFLYKYKLWRKTARTKAIDGQPAKVFYDFNKQKEVTVPRMGGVLIWTTTIFLAFLMAFLAKIFDGVWLSKLNFLSRDQTWLPLATLAAASLLGLIDDVLQVFGKGKYIGGGLSFWRRFAAVFLIGLVGGWWFFTKLGWSTIHVPGVGDFEIGFWYLPLFILVTLACWSGGVIDGLDGLAGGVFSIIFGAFTVISFSQMQYNLAAFCAAITGATLSFLWFNIPPARFYMGETGIIGLTATLAVVSFLTDSVLVLPIIAGLLVLESGSVITQLLFKKFFHRKVFIAAPFHHHLQAKGWSAERITMRFWILGMIMAVVGVIIKMLG